LFEEAGFASCKRVERSLVAESDALEPMPGDDDATKRMNANIERLNALLFGPQDYALVAVR
jgi:hypothetical protein